MQKLYEVKMKIFFPYSSDHIGSPSCRCWRIESQIMFIFRAHSPIEPRMVFKIRHTLQPSSWHMSLWCPFLAKNLGIDHSNMTLPRCRIFESDHIMRPTWGMWVLLVAFLNQTPIVESGGRGRRDWLVVDLIIDTIKTHYQRTTFSNCINYSTLNNQHNWRRPFVLIGGANTHALIKTITKEAKVQIVVDVSIIDLVTEIKEKLEDINLINRRWSNFRKKLT